MRALIHSQRQEANSRTSMAPGLDESTPRSWPAFDLLFAPIHFKCPFTIQCNECGHYLGKGHVVEGYRQRVGHFPHRPRRHAALTRHLPIYVVGFDCPACRDEIRVRTHPHWGYEYVCEEGGRRAEEPFGPIGTGYNIAVRVGPDGWVEFVYDRCLTGPLCGEGEEEENTEPAPRLARYRRVAQLVGEEGKRGSVRSRVLGNIY